MKKIFLIIIVLLYSNQSFSQSTFSIKIQSGKDEYLSDFIETENHEYIISGRIGTGDNQNGYIVRLSSTGDILEEKIIELVDSNFVIQKIIELNDGNFMLYGFAGSKIDNFKNTHVIQKYDSNFNLLMEKRYKTHVPNCSIKRTRILKINNSNIILYGYVSMNNEFDLEHFYFETTQNGDSIHAKYTDIQSSIFCIPHALLEKDDYSGYFCYANSSNSPNVPAEILELNTLFETVNYIGVPNYIHGNGELKHVSDTSYILCGTTYEPTREQDNDLGIAILDKRNNSIIKYNHSGKPDTIEIFGVYKCMEYSENDNYIYTGGTCGYDYLSGLYRSVPSYYTFVKYNKSIDILEERFIKNKNFNVVFFFKKTSDGGFIYISTSYDYTNPENGLDAHILKVDANGNPPVSVNSKEKSHELIIYPNPAKNNLTIRTAVQRIGGIMSIYSISGKLTLQKSISKTITNINVANLPKGTYIFKYTVKGKKIESGKFVKK